NYFKHGIISVYLKNDVMAEADFRKSIRMDGSYKYPYVGLAQVLSRQNQNDAALSYSNMVLDMYPDYGEAYIVRGGIYYLKSDLLNAISDVSRAINLDSKSDSLYMIRARYNYEIKKPNNSIDDYSKAVALNDSNYMAYFRRAGIYEELKNMNEASADYARFLRLTEHNPTEAKNVRIAKEKIYNLNAETDKPFITLVAPKLNADGNIEVALNASTLLIDGIIRDASTIDNLKIKGDSYAFDKPSNEVFFTKEVSIANDEYISLTATDIYYNISNKSYKIVRTEIDPPVIDVLTPYTSDYREIFLESIDPTFYIEGKIADQSLIKMITINGIEAKFLKDTKNPHFSSTVNIEGKESIIIQALDIYGNKAETTYKLNRESAQILAGNPMGKTWVIFIDNSDYQSFTSLDGPSKDIATMKASLSKYDIHNVIEKKNMTKTQMEKFFALELRDYVKNQKVNSLMVWYAGHGKFINETGYWIPVDAKRDEEFTYFNINSLKAFMQSYTNFVTHVLVVTDACESGPSFYAAMRGSGDRECGDSIPKTFKSSQVFSSAGYELAADNSPFTKTFAKSLDYNTNSCIPIDKIVTNVSNSVGQGSKQSPKFGKIQGLEDEDGTFFFIKKSH
ncbi:MAG: Tfp pilus assembly protein PilF, partial [Bacteroidia bacterium]